MKSPLHDEAADQAEDEDTTKETVTPTGFASFAGRVDPLELIRFALEETHASGVGRLLDVCEFDGDPRR